MTRAAPQVGHHPAPGLLDQHREQGAVEWLVVELVGEVGGVGTGHLVVAGAHQRPVDPLHATSLPGPLTPGLTPRGG